MCFIWGMVCVCVCVFSNKRLLGLSTLAADSGSGQERPKDPPLSVGGDQVC